MANRLASETSPYLFQHKDNPVDWWPWGEAAFAEARRRDVPVFLSVGYSTCYWCHVMERQVFENETIAGQMNEGFVNVKVDREERPDVDEHYMTATQVLAGQGGWPMSVFLTPEGRPFFAGTYFPPEDTHGRPGFPRVLEALSEAWSRRRNEITTTVESLDEILQRLGQPSPPREDVTFDEPTLRGLVDRSMADFDPRFGGFGGAPKFPRQTLLEMLLAARRLYGERAARLDEPLKRTLDAMANGGIRDHLGGGFHRYSTDAKWLVPHFEIMLYDQAMLACCYVEASRLYGSERYARVARGVLDFVLREMTDDGGAFHTAFDAEVDAKEGGSYLWTPQEVEEVLGPEDAAEFNAVYGLDRGFNFADPHGPNPHTPDSNVLFLAEPEREAEPGIAEMRRKLLAARGRRKQPALDTKILTSWNAMVIGALASAGAALPEPRYIEAATRAADWLLRNHRDAHGGLIHASRDGKIQATGGFLDDYALLAQALISLWRATGNDVWLDHASETADAMQKRFGDGAGGFWFSEPGSGEVPGLADVRRKVGADSPLPSGNAVAAMVMLELDRPDICRGTLEVFAGQITDLVGNTSALLHAAMLFVERHGPFSVTGQPAAAEGPADESERAVQLLSAEWRAPERLAVTVRIEDGFHLHSADAERAMGVEIGSPHAAFLEARLPASEGGRIVGEARFELLFSEPLSDQPVEVYLRYQACDETRCLMPVTRRFEVRREGA